MVDDGLPTGTATPFDAARTSGRSRRTRKGRGGAGWCAAARLDDMFTDADLAYRPISSLLRRGDRGWVRRGDRHHHHADTDTLADSGAVRESVVNMATSLMLLGTITPSAGAFR